MRARKLKMGNLLHHQGLFSGSTTHWKDRFKQHDPPMLQWPEHHGAAFGKQRPEKGTVNEEITMPFWQPTTDFHLVALGAASLCASAASTIPFILQMPSVLQPARPPCYGGSSCSYT